MSICECCKQTGDDLLKQSAGYYLCLKCSNRVKMRQAEANVKRYSTATYSIDRAELFALRDDKLLPLRTFIYFALRLDYPKGGISNKVELAEFCNRWRISQYDFLSATASLGKKGIVHIKTQSLEIETPSRSDRIAKLEQALKEQP